MSSMADGTMKVMMPPTNMKIHTQRAWTKLTKRALHFPTLK